MKIKQFLFLLVCTFAFANTYAANRYWVGGAATWDAANTACWSETSGGASGATAPTIDDDVFFESGTALTVTLGAATPVLNSITFTSRNVTFAGAFAITTTNMTVTTSQVKFVDNVTVISALTFSGTTPRITQNSLWGKSFTMGNGGAFTLTGNSATNYFGGTTSAANSSYAFNTTSALTVYFDPSTATPLTLGGITVIKGLITLGNNVKLIRLILSATNSQELILAPNVTFTYALGGTGALTALANGGVLNASASGSKVIVSTTNNVPINGAGRLFKTGTVINHFEFDATGKTFNLFESIRVRKITKTAGTIATTATKTITVEAGGSIVEGAGSIGTDIFFETPVTRYWVGGAAGSWFNAANWGTSTGDLLTPGIPASVDSIVFDNAAGNENPTVTLTDHVTAADITFTSSNVNFAGADSINTNSMTLNSSQVKFVDHVKVNSSLTFSGTDPRITQQAATSGRAFLFGNGGAFTLTGNSATNYFTGNTVAYYTYNTTSALTVYFNPTTTTAGALVVKKGLITLGNSVNTNRITLNDVNSQELVVGTGATLGLVGAGTSSFTNAANGGVINASATDSKVLITSTAPTILGVQSPGAAITGRIFKDGNTINHLEYNSASVFYLPFAMTVKNLTLTAGTINNSTNNITIPTGGNLVVAAGTTSAALIASLPSAPANIVATSGDKQASVAFDVPANGGSVLLDYTVTASPGGLTATGSASPIVVTGLTNGTAYTFTVTSSNSLGNSTESSVSNAVTPSIGTSVDNVMDKNTTISLVDNTLIINYNSTFACNYSVKLRSLNGQVIQSNKFSMNAGNNTIKLNIDNLATGIYLVEMKDGINAPVSKKIIKN
jgi:hypothetical protein